MWCIFPVDVILVFDRNTTLVQQKIGGRGASKCDFFHVVVETLFLLAKQRVGKTSGRQSMFSQDQCFPTRIHVGGWVGGSTVDTIQTYDSVAVEREWVRLWVALPMAR